MLDYDNDGFLDIYVSNYGRWNYPEDHHRAGDAEKKVWLYSSPQIDPDRAAPFLSTTTATTRLRTSMTR